MKTEMYKIYIYIFFCFTLQKQPSKETAGDINDMEGGDAPTEFIAFGKRVKGKAFST